MSLTRDPAAAAVDAAQAAPLFAQFKAGNLGCVALYDGYIPTPPFLLAPEVDVAELGAFLARHGEDLATLTTPITCLLVDFPDGRRMLIDAGMGKAAGHAGPNLVTVGQLKYALDQAGIEPASIDTVLVSHIHPDHVGGLFGEHEAPHFPNATYYVPREDAEFWGGEHPDLGGTMMPPPARPGVIATAQRFLQLAAAKTVLFAAGDTVLPGVRSMLLPGHTPGQVGFILDGGADTLFYAADAAGHSAVSLLHPEWRFAFDTDARQATETRRTMLALLAEKGWITYTPHFPWPGVGKIVRRDGQIAWEPLR